MTSIVNPSDYPISPDRRKFLCDSDAWNGLHHAYRQFHLTTRLRAILRMQILSQSFDEPTFDSVTFRHCDVVPVIDHGSKRILTLSHRVRSALGDLANAHDDCFISMLKRLFSGEISVIIRPAGQIDHPWRVVQPIAFRESEVRFQGSQIVDANGNRYTAALRDTCGLPLEQGIMVYGDLQIVPDLIDLQWNNPFADTYEGGAARIKEIAALQTKLETRLWQDLCSGVLVAFGPADHGIQDDREPLTTDWWQARGCQAVSLPQSAELLVRSPRPKPSMAAPAIVEQQENASETESTGEYIPYGHRFIELTKKGISDKEARAIVRGEMTKLRAMGSHKLSSNDTFNKGLRRAINHIRKSG